MRCILFPLIFISFLFFSCLDNNKTTPKNKVSEAKEISYYKVVFPDTVQFNTSYNGKVIYKTELDTIIDNFDNTQFPRYAYFVMRKTDNVNYSLDDLANFKLDSLGALENGVIPLINIKFDKVGNYYLDGMISDFVLLNLNQKDKNGEDLVRMITNNIRVTHKVTVVDNND